MVVGFFVASALVVTLLPTTANAYERYVLGPQLQRRLLSSKAPGREVLAAETVDLFVRANDLTALHQALAEQGVQATVHGEGELFSVRASLASAEQLSASQLIQRIELAPRLYPQLDRSARDARATDVHEGHDLKMKRT